MTSGYNTFKDDDNKPVSGDERYMHEALKEAQFAFEEEEVPIGAVVVWNGRIIARGHNMTERLHDPSAHAEMIALTAATEAMGGKYLDECTLYVTVDELGAGGACRLWRGRPEAWVLEVHAVAVAPQDGSRFRRVERRVRRNCQ